MRIATWNVNSIRMRIDHIVNFLKSDNIDVLLLQELKCTNDQFPYEILESAGYNCVVLGQKTYNGVAILSKYLTEEIRYGNEIFNDQQARYVECLICGKRIASVYVPNGQEVGATAYDYKINFFEQLTSYLEKEIKNDDFIIGGDFNVCRNDMDVYNPKLWKDKICCSDKERECFEKLLSIGFFDWHRELYNNEKIYTWWDYRFQGFAKNHGLRIDYLLTTRNIDVQSMYIDLCTRSKEKPSDHAAVVMNIQ